MMVRVKKPAMTPMRLVKPLLWMLVAFYMGYHTLHGDRGLYSLMRDRREMTQLQDELAKTKTQREKVELRVSHLRDNSLDRDLLDEQMRRMMGVMHKGEIVILNEPNS